MNQSHHSSKRPHPKSEAQRTALARQELVIAGELLQDFGDEFLHMSREPKVSFPIPAMNKVTSAIAELGGLLLLLPDSSQSSPILRRTKRTPARVQAAFLPLKKNKTRTHGASAGRPFVLNESNIEKTFQTIREKLLGTSAPIVVLDPAHRN